jgi:hypothetical protein
MLDGTMRIRYGDEDREPSVYLRPTGDVSVQPREIDAAVESLAVAVENGTLDTSFEDFALEIRGEDGTLREVCVDRAWLRDGVVTLPVAALELPAGRHSLFVTRIKGYEFTADGGPSDESRREVWAERFHGEAWSRPIDIIVRTDLTRTQAVGDCQRVGPISRSRSDLD